jgi:hypothetical protein
MTKVTAHVEAVEPRQHHVEEHEIGPERAKGGEHFRAPFDRFHLESRVGQAVGKHAGERAIILDHEDSLFHGA